MEDPWRGSAATRRLAAAPQHSLMLMLMRPARHCYSLVLSQREPDSFYTNHHTAVISPHALLSYGHEGLRPWRKALLAFKLISSQSSAEKDIIFQNKQTNCKLSSVNNA
jgi:hypothetical protein